MVDRLEKVEVAGRKSKSLEESKGGGYLSPEGRQSVNGNLPMGLSYSEIHSEGFHASLRNVPGLGENFSDGSSGNAITFSREAFTREFQILTKVDSPRNKNVRSYINALRNLEEKGVLKSVGKSTIMISLLMCLGSDKKGTQHYLIFGFAYSKLTEQEDKDQIKVDVSTVFLYISDT